MLLKQFPEKKESDFVDSDYKQYVIGRKTNITITSPDSSSAHTEEYTIQNIYYEQDYYYECINEVVGEFIIFSEYFSPSYYSESGIKKYVPSQRMYFFTDFAYQTKYFMDYINEAYVSNEYHIDIVDRNVIKGPIDKNRILQFRDMASLNKTSVFETIFIIVAIALAFVSIALFIVSEIHTNKLSVLLCFVAVFAPYLIFKVLYFVTKNIVLFSITSTRINGILMIVYIAAIIFVCVFEFTIKKRKELYGTADIEI